MKKQYILKSIIKTPYRTPIYQIRAFSKNPIIFSENESVPSHPPLRPFSQSTEETRSFLNTLLLRDLMAIEQLNHIIQDNTETVRRWNTETALTVDHGPQIEELMHITEIDIVERNRHTESAEIIDAILEGVEPPIDRMGGWITIRDDLDNSQDPGLEDLRNYVRSTLDTHITRPWLQEMAELMRTHRANLPEDRSRDNSQVSDSIDGSDSDLESSSSIYESVDSNQNESDSSSNSDSDDYQSVNSNQNESDSSSDSDSDDYQSADSNQNESDSNSDSDSDNYPSNNDQGSNLDNNQSNGDNQSNFDINESPNNYESNQREDDLSSTNVSQSIDQNECNPSSDKKLITDDALDLSDTLHMFFPDSPVENKSTIDFVLQKQQEEMPDIVDSDGGD
jgi:hypothetical protein